MSFLNPLMLVGLFGALIPIVIHLIHRRKPRRQLFAAIEFVLRSVERVENRWRLRRFLLLASRVLLISAIALAASKPIFGEKHILALTRGGPLRTAIVIDASLSMRQDHSDRSAFARALTAARNLVDQMGPEDQTILVFAGDPATNFPETLTADRNLLLSHLDRAEASFAHVDLAPAVSLAATLVAPVGESRADPSPELQPKQRIVLLSDMAGHAFRAAADLGPEPDAIQIDVVDVLEGVSEDARTNRVITELSLTSIPASTPGTIEARSRVRAFPGGDQASRAPKLVGISLNGTEGELVNGSLELAPGAMVDKSLVHAFADTGHLWVRTVLEADALREDDTHYGIADVRKPVRSLIVDGAPSGVPKEGEVFYVERALLAGARDQPAPRIITVDELHRAELSNFDVLMLIGVPSLPPVEASRILSFVEAGGGLLISTTKDLDVESYNGGLGAALPRRLRGLKDALGGSAGSTGPLSLLAPTEPHPVLEIFDAEALDGLTSARTQGYFLLEPARGKTARVLLNFEDGQPALLEAKHGSGLVMLWTTSLDRDLSDFVIRPAFLPLFRRALLHLGHALSPTEVRSVTLGERHTIHPPRGVRQVEVIAPDGAAERLELHPEEDTKELFYDRAKMPGHYRVRVGALGSLEDDPALAFAVNVDVRESDLRTIRAEEALTVLRGTGTEAAERALPSLAELGDGPLSRPEMLAMLLLVLACIAFLGEGALTAERRANK